VKQNSSCLIGFVYIGVGTQKKTFQDNGSRFYASIWLFPK